MMDTPRPSSDSWQGDLMTQLCNIYDDDDDDDDVSELGSLIMHITF
jgi:hypothetical protein